MTDDPRTPNDEPGIEQTDAGPDPIGPDAMDDVEGASGLPELPDESSTLEEPADADADEGVEHIEETGEPFDGNFA